MKMQDIDNTIEEINRFNKRVEELKEAMRKYGTRPGNAIYGFPTEVGAIRRASMDLTRALSKLRNNKE